MQLIILLTVFFISCVSAKEHNAFAIDKNIEEPSNDLMLRFDHAAAHFSRESYTEALEDFDYILNSLHEHEPHNALFGAALWGRLFCHAYLTQDDHAYEDLFLIQSYFNQIYSDLPCRCQNVIPQARTTGDYIMTIAEFENPHEQISSSECKNRVRGTGDAMRILAMRIPNSNLSKLVMFSISELENFAHGCCERAHWTDCLGPIVDAWKYMRKCMDRGAEIAPYIIFPGR